MKVSLSTDSDGFLSQECPSCEQRFKVLYGQGSEEPVSHCPYCGYHGHQCWLTKGQRDYVTAVATEAVVVPELKKLQREFKGGVEGLFSIDMELDLPKRLLAPVEVDGSFDILYFQCCRETIKVRQQKQHYCIICGMEIDMEANDAKRVFLSHKGVDKAVATDFKSTLELLGYEPWLDEDAMPAGTVLERGLLHGMQDSCGVVFFITPSFSDESFLRAEIDYAIQNKREKGDRFSIVTLLLPGDDGSRGTVPDLLKPYLWKEPASLLEALQEIIRGLPVVVGRAEWRDQVGGVVVHPPPKSASSDLSAEARVLLKEAANGDGTIRCQRHLGGEDISASGKSILPDSEPRTLASWRGGILDLQRLGFIDEGRHSEHAERYRVTREGYAAAEKLCGDSQTEA